jgi:hypothetical protein
VSGPEGKQHCTSCGLPLSRATCQACGGSAAPIPLSDGDAASAAAYASEPDRPELDLARDAAASGDYGRLVSHCLAALGATDAKMQQAAEGPLFKAMIRGVAVFAQIRTASAELAIECPVVRLPRTQYVPALRLALELSDRDEAPFRFSVRGELLLVRMVGRLTTLTPNDVCRAVDAVAGAAWEGARAFVGELQARPILPNEHASLAPDALPRSTELGKGAPARPAPTASASKKGALGAIPSLVDASGDDEDETLLKRAPAVQQPPGRTPTAIPAVLRGAGGGPPSPEPARRGKVPTPARIEQKPRLRPPGEPRVPVGSGAPTPVVGVPALTAEAVAAHLAPPTTKPFPLQRPAPPARGADKTLVSEAANASPATAPSAVAGHARVSVSAGEAPDPLADTFLGDSGPRPPRKSGKPTDAFCELLHHAQTLGAVLSFADQPATMCLLIRATVYRAMLDFDAVTPNGTAALYVGTKDLTREIFITAPGKRRGAMAIPSTAPAFELMSQLIAAQGEAGPPAEPSAVVPITTAQEAKQHLARYVSEIDQAPGDLDLRHFLALGAISELLVRTKLPGPTQERLRGILTHAQKEGPKQQVVELMMTALTRMMA